MWSDTSEYMLREALMVHDTLCRQCPQCNSESVQPVTEERHDDFVRFAITFIRDTETGMVPDADVDSDAVRQYFCNNCRTLYKV